MIPILYEATETAFVSNGICRLRDCLSCVVTEERNGIYECDFDYPVDGAHFSDIIPGRIIAVEHDESNDVQPFDIVSYTKPLNGIVTFHAVHISYRLTGMVVSASNITSLADAFTAFGNSTPTNPFTFETDKTSTGYVGAFDGTPRPIRQILGGVEGSLLDAYGGEYEWDRWTVKLHSARGTQKDFTIKYGVNLLDYNDETDYSGVYTTCIPFWKGQDDNGLEIVVKGNKVDPSFSQYAQREICVPMDLSDKFETQPTTAQLEQMALARMLTSETYSPAQNITVDFLHLADMDEYERFEVLFKCKLCDTIRVFFPRYGMNANYKIVKTEYNVLDEKYTSLELGTLATSLADVIGVSSDSSTGNVSLPYVLKAGDTMTGDLTVDGNIYSDNTWRETSDNYGAIVHADGTDNWINIGTPSANSGAGFGLLPNTSGVAGSGHGYLGTSSWYWKYAYIDQVYVAGSQLIYITQAGTSNGWYYQKYSNGYGEAWYYGSKSLAHYTTANGFYAYGYNAINLPFTMSNNNYQCDVDFLIGNGFSFGASVRKSTTQLTNLFALSTASGTQTVYLNAHIYGTLA